MTRKLATTVHPTGQRIDYYEDKKGQVQQCWAKRNGYYQIIPEAWMNGLLADIRAIGGSVQDFREGA